jgi:membrane protease YdiL (CAAX protease family)
MLLKHPVAGFVVLTYVITHLVNPVIVETMRIAFAGAAFSFTMGYSLVAQYGGTLAALFLVKKLYGVQGIKTTLRYSKPKRADAKWFVVAILLPLALILLSYVAAGVSLPTLFSILAEHWPTYLLVTGGFLITAGFAEEYGWRGFMLPQLLQTQSPLRATGWVYVVCAVWHFPALLAGWKDEPLVSWLILVLPVTVLHSWLFFKSKGNLLVVVLYHACFDAQYAFYSKFIPGASLANAPFHQGWTFIMAHCAVAALVVWATRGTLGFSRADFSPYAYFGADEGAEAHP